MVILGVVDGTGFATLPSSPSKNPQIFPNHFDIFDTSERNVTTVPLSGLSPFLWPHQEWHTGSGDDTWSGLIPAQISTTDFEIHQPWPLWDSCPFGSSNFMVD